MKPAAALLLTAMAIAGCGTRSGPDIQPAVVPTTGVCQHTCTPDPLPATVNCGAAEAGIEFLEDPAIWTFEEDGVPDNPDPAVNLIKKAVRMYSYTDESQFIASFFAYDTVVRGYLKKTWEPPTTVMDRCAGVPAGENHTIHIQGGPFLAWGGGVGVSMKDFTPLNCGGSTEALCLGRDPTIPSFDASTGSRTPDTVHATLNLSEWEGVSFWGRRGPDSQGGLRVLVGDRYTDDDVSFLMAAADPSQPRYCERVAECAGMDHMACVEATQEQLDQNPQCRNPQMGRENPATGMPVAPTYSGPPHAKVGGTVGDTVRCNSCDRNRCNEEWPAYPGNSDPAFVDRPCLPYTFKNGVSSSFCFDPARGERPAEPDEQCGDHWTRTVPLTDQWRFYTVPFSSMLQQGWAKHTTTLDLNNVTLVRFTWDGGWIDYYLDDVRFYRHKK